MNNQKINKKHIVKIPKDIILCYSENYQTVFLKGTMGQKLIKLKVKLELIDSKNFIVITDQFFGEVSTKEKKRRKSYQGTCAALIKRTIFEISKIIFKKLKLIGVGYKIFKISYANINLLKLNLGFSHSIYFKIPDNVEIICYKTNKILISGNDHQNVTQIAARIRSYKIPEIYKGKGILYENELIKLKEGKKV